VAPERAKWPQRPPTAEPVLKEVEDMDTTFESLRVCGSCFVLNGGTGTRRQLCHCVPEEEHRALAESALRERGTSWHHVGEICRCRGAEVVDAQTKYEKWFCPRCLRFADETNRACGRCAVPVGLHSIVNGVYASSNSCETRLGAAVAADQLDAFFRESGGVWGWGRRVVERQWRRAGLPHGHDIAIGDYLEAVWANDVDKASLFDELAAARGIHTEFGVVPLDAVWHTTEDGRSLEAFERIVWGYPDGVEEYAGLWLRAVSDGEGTWSWGVTIEEDAVGEGDPVLGRGVASTQKQATSDCETAARRLIDGQEVFFGPSASSSPRAEALLGAADGLTELARSRTPVPLTADGGSGHDP